MLLLSMPARFAGLRDSLWLDEAWVANSLSAPSLAKTLYYDRWAQSTPPLFLVISRAVLLVAGDSEPALRIVPWLAVFFSILILAVVLRRLFSAPVALLGFAMVVSNYWLIKYSQQVKQYGTDLLTACLMLFLLERLLSAGGRLTNLFRIALLGCVSSFLSFVSVFWLASCVVAVWLANPGLGPTAGVHAGRVRFWRAIGLALLFALCLGCNYFVFIRPNLTPDQFRDFADDFIDLTRVGASLRGLEQTFGALLIPLGSPWATAAVRSIEAVLAFGAVRTVRISLRGNPTALTVLLAGLLPILEAILVSAAHLYPILSYPRLLIWAVPCCVVLFGYAVIPPVDRLARVPIQVYDRLLRYGVPTVCVAVVTLSQMVFFAFPRPTEKNRDAAKFIRSHAGDSDFVFVHGGMNEQFLYYRRLLSWNPRNVYFGNTDWPCCAVNKDKRTSSPGVRDLLDDVTRAAALARSHSLWLLLPSGGPDHWSGSLSPQIDAIPGVLSVQGCRQALKQAFSQTLVLAFSCE